MTKKELQEEIRYYKQIIEKIKRNPVETISGSLRISVDGKQVRLYHHSDEYKNGDSYIASENIATAKKLAQKTYDVKVLKTAQKRYAQLSRLLKDYEENEIDEIYDHAHYVRKSLITPVEETIQQKYDKWKSQEYQGKEFFEGTPVILTERGERVRSKSEKIMADFFYRKGIEYKYEKPLYLKGYGVIYPDFTFFSLKLGKEIYLEHAGMMDDGEYSSKAVKKISIYENNGLFLGERLIVTFETSDKILNTNELERIIARFF